MQKIAVTLSLLFCRINMNDMTATKAKAKRRVSIAIALILLGVLISLPFLFQKDKINYVSTASATKGDITSILSYSGTLDFENTQTIAFSEQFFCEDVFVKKGQRVNKGDKLFSGYTFSISGEKSKMQTYSADFDGIVSTLSVSKKTANIQGKPCAVIKDISTPKASFYVNKYDSSSVKIGQNATIEIGNYIYTGTISFVGSSMETITSTQGATMGIYTEIALKNDTGTEKVIKSAATLEDSSGDLIETEKRPLLSEIIIDGMNVDITITTDTVKDVLTIPISAVKSDKDGDFCFAVDPSNKAEKLYLIIGATNDSSYEVKSGLNKGDRIIINPSAKLLKGDSVIEK